MAENQLYSLTSWPRGEAGACKALHIGSNPMDVSKYALLVEQQTQLA